jgi:hypothetical protein
MGSGMPKAAQLLLLVLAIAALSVSMSVASVKYALWIKKPPVRSYLKVAVADGSETMPVRNALLTE